MLKDRKWIFIFVLLVSNNKVFAENNIFYLELVINGRVSDRVTEVIQHDNKWEVSYTELIALGLKLDFPDRQTVLLNDIPGVNIKYDADFQRLWLQVPNYLLPTQYLGKNSARRSQNESRRDSGLFINYSALSAIDSNEFHQSSLWHELNYFEHDSYFVSSGIFQDSNRRKPGYTRFETFYQSDDEEGLWSFTLGDVINATPNWGRSIRMGGIRIARDYELDPTLITFPLPEFYGESALPGSVDLFINGQLRWRDEVNSGPFFIDMMPSLSGAGVAQVVTTNAQGQQVRQAVNFYIASELLAPGMIDYDVTAGFRREQFGFASDEYATRPVISSSVRYGLEHNITPQVLLQAGEGIHLIGGGLNFLIGSVGVIDISHSVSEFHGDEGWQKSIAYSYSKKRFGLNSRYLKRHGGYRDLGSLDANILQDTQVQFVASIYHEQFSSLSAGYFRVEDRARGRNEIANISWNQYFRSGFTVFANFNRELHRQKESTFSLALSIPFGAAGQASLSTQRGEQGNWRKQIQVMENVPYAGGIGWRFAADDSVDRNRYFAVDWRTKYAEFTASTYATREREQYVAEVTGAVIAMGDDIYASPLVTDAFALVSSGYKNLPVMIGNQFVGRTGEDGKLLVPDLSSYLENRISIDPMQLPANITFESIEQLVIPRRKGGVHVTFPIRLSQAAILEVRLPGEQFLSPGTLLTTNEENKKFLVGWDGEVYVENLVEPLTLYWDEGECEINVEPLKDNAVALPRIGPLYCQPMSLPILEVQQ